MSVRLIKHFFAIAGGQILNVISQILLAPLFLKHWSISVYGAWLVLSGLTTYLGTLDMGMNYAVGNRLLASYVHKDHPGYMRTQHSATAFYLYLALGTSILVGLVLWLVPVQSWAGVNRSAVPDAPWIIWLLALQVLWMMPVGLLGNFYATVGDPARSKWINNWRAAGLLLVTGLGLLADCSMSTLALLQLTPLVPVAIFVLWDMRRRYPQYLPGLAQANMVVIRELIKPSVMFAVIGIAFSLTFQGSLLVVSSIFGAVSAAIFVTARTLTSMAIQTVRIIGTTAWPDMTILYAEGNMARLRLLNRLVVFTSASLCVAIASALWFEGLSVVAVWMPKVHINLWFFRLLLVYIILQAPWIANTNVTAAINRHHNQAWSYLGSGLISIASMIMLAPWAGLNAIPIGLIIGEALACYHFVVKDTCTVLGEPYGAYAVRLWSGLIVITAAALSAGWLIHPIAYGPPVMHWAEVGAATLIASCLAARCVWISAADLSLILRKIRSSVFTTQKVDHDADIIPELQIQESTVPKKDCPPKVSIVTAMYNHKPYLKRRIDSILNQTLQDWEWIIVDDCSPDGSFEYAKELTRHDPRVTVLQNQTNRHIAYTNQRGIDLARGEFLYRTDSDDYCDYRFLERMVALLEKHPTVVMAHCRGLALDQYDGAWGGWPKKKEYVIGGWEEIRRNLVQYMIKSPTLLFRRRAVVEAGGFATMPLLSNHDWYLSLRVCLLGDVAYVDDPLAAHRRHGSNVSGDMIRQMDARQMEIELFGVIDNVISHIPSEHMIEAKELQRIAHFKAAVSLLPVIDWARQNHMDKQADELAAMIQKYVPLEVLAERKSRLDIKTLLLKMGTPVIKWFTYKKLPTIDALNKRYA